MVALCTLLVAAIPVIHWYFLRLTDGGETESLVPLVAGLFFCIRDRRGLVPSAAGLWLLAAYALAYPFLPGLVRATLFVIALCLVLGVWRKPGPVLLFLLALPWSASLDFFLGYPLRLLTSVNTEFLVKLTGTEISRHGVMLLHEGTTVGVDPACSGLNLLWSTGLLTGLIAAIFRLDWRGILALGPAALLLSLMGNSVRAAILFFPEAGIVAMPHSFHSGIGLVVAGLVFLPLIRLARHFSRPLAIAGTEFALPRWPMCVVALLAGIVPFFSERETSVGLPPSMTLTEYRGRALIPVPLTPVEEKFYGNFPGSIAIYEGDEFKLIVRKVSRATRKLHPAHHCLRAEGFEVAEKSVIESDDGKWLEYVAERDGEEFRIRERITIPGSGANWTEISQWFWHALFHPERWAMGGSDFDFRIALPLQT